MYSYREEKKVCIVETGGSLTVAERDQFKSFVLELLDDLEFKGLVVNFNKLQRFDSFGMGVIIALFKAAKKIRKPFALTELSDSNRELFSFAGLDSTIDIYKSDNDAITVMTIKD